jgi:hypothetical protein
MIFRRGAQQGGIAECKAMINRTHALPVFRQCQLLGLSRSTAFPPDSRVSLKTTNYLESLNSQLGQLSDKVDHWWTED